MHPGWLRFLEHAHQEWGPGGIAYHAALDKALDLTDSDAAASHARQIRAARRLVETLLTWPTEEIRRLRTATDQLAPHAPFGSSRRGGL